MDDAVRIGLCGFTMAFEDYVRGVRARRGPADVLRAASRRDAAPLASPGAERLRVHDQGVAARHPRRLEPDVPPSPIAVRRLGPRGSGRLSHVADRPAGVGAVPRVRRYSSRDGDSPPVSRLVPPHRGEHRPPASVLRHRPASVGRPDALGAARPLAGGGPRRALSRPRPGPCRRPVRVDHGDAGTDLPATSRDNGRAARVFRHRARSVGGHAARGAQSPRVRVVQQPPTRGGRSALPGDPGTTPIAARSLSLIAALVFDSDQRSCARANSKHAMAAGVTTDPCGRVRTT